MHSDVFESISRAGEWFGHNDYTVEPHIVNMPTGLLCGFDHSKNKRSMSPALTTGESEIKKMHSIME